MVKKIAIIVPGILPVPATIGGAIEQSINLLIDQNEIFKKLEITIISTYESKAYGLSGKYKFTKFLWIHRGLLYEIINFAFRVCAKFFDNLDHLDSEIIKKHLRKNFYDKIIIHGNTTYLKVVSKVVAKEKLIFYVHSNIFSEQNDNNIAICNLPGKIICVSDFVKNETMKNSHVTENMIDVIRNPIDYDSFVNCKKEINIKLMRELNINPEDIIILFVGRIVENKGIIHLLEAFKNIEVNQTITLIVIGSFGSLFGLKESKSIFKEKIMDLVDQLNINVVFTGFVQNYELPFYHSIGDILVMPSLVEEAAGKTAMEAMASGIPVITTTAGGIPEYVSMDAGILLERNEYLVNNLTNSLVKLIENPDLREKMGRAGQKLALNFHPNRYYEDYVNAIFER